MGKGKFLFGAGCYKQGTPSGVIGESKEVESWECDSDVAIVNPRETKEGFPFECRRKFLLAMTEVRRAHATPMLSPGDHFRACAWRITMVRSYQKLLFRSTYDTF